MKKPRQPTTRQIFAAQQWAQDRYEVEGEIEIDDNPSKDEISACDEWREEGGFYVKAWIWVPYENSRE